MKPTILVVDDEPGVRSSLSGVLRGFAVFWNVRKAG